MKTLKIGDTVKHKDYIGIVKAVHGNGAVLIESITKKNCIIVPLNEVVKVKMQ